MTVRADFLFTLPAVIVQPLSGAWLIFYGGFAWNDYWLVLTYALYVLAGADTALYSLHPAIVLSRRLAEDYWRRAAPHLVST